MKKAWLVIGIIGIVVSVCAGGVFAEDQGSSEGAIEAVTDAATDAAAETDSGTTSSTNWKEERFSDKQAVKEQKDTIKQNAGAAKDEEQALRDQIHEAVQNKDFETAKQLNDQLKTTHQENVQQKNADKTALQGSRQEMKDDRKAARSEGQGTPPQGKQGVPQGERRGPPQGERRGPPKVDSQGKPLPGVRRGPPQADRQGPPSGINDRQENKFDRREDRADRKEDRFDRKENKADRRENNVDRKENKIDRRDTERSNAPRAGGQSLGNKSGEGSQKPSGARAGGVKKK